MAEANARKIALNITKVQKPLYVAYGTYLRIYGERLVNEHPEAWPYGPVFPTTRERLLHRDLYTVAKSDIQSDTLRSMAGDAQLNEVVESTLSEFGCWNAGELSAWAHSKGSPWDEATRWTTTPYKNTFTTRRLKWTIRGGSDGGTARRIAPFISFCINVPRWYLPAVKTALTRV